MNYKEVVNIVSKLWLTSDDIMKLCSCGKNSALQIRKNVEQLVLDSGKFIPPSMTKHVPTRLVLEYIGIDENYIFEMASRQI